MHIKFALVKSMLFLLSFLSQNLIYTRGPELKVRITKLNKHLPSLKVNIDSSFGGDS